MANLTLTGTPSPSTPTPPPGHSIPGLKAGEDLAAGAPCYIKSDGLVYQSNGTANTAPSAVHGWAPAATKSGEAVTLYRDIDFGYPTAGLTPGAPYYVSATAGLLSDSATTGGTVPCAHAVDANRIRVSTVLK